MQADREAARMREAQQKTALDDIFGLLQKRIAELSVSLSSERTARRDDIEELACRVDSHTKAIVDKVCPSFCHSVYVSVSVFACLCESVCLPALLPGEKAWSLRHSLRR